MALNNSSIYWELLMRRLQEHPDQFAPLSIIEITQRFHEEITKFQLLSEPKMNKFRLENPDLYLNTFPLIDYMEKFVSNDINSDANDVERENEDISLNGSQEITSLSYIYNELVEIVTSIPNNKKTAEQVYGEAKTETKVKEFATSKQQLLILKCLETQGLFNLTAISDSMAKQAKLLYRLFNRSSDNTYSNLKDFPRIEEFNEKDMVAVRDYFQETEMGKVVDILNSEIEKKKTGKK